MENKLVSLEIIPTRLFLASMLLQGMLSNPKQIKHKSNIFIRFAQLFFPTIALQWCNSDYEDIVREAYILTDKLIQEDL